MNNLICPICKNSLCLDNKTLKCSNNHCYDISKEGYVNLLPVNFKKTKLPGDNLKMVTARKNFLASGEFEPLVNKLSQIISELSLTEPQILDLGCGEGYYTNELYKNFPTSHFNGVDISKTAVKYASKKSKNINYFVASSFDLPIKNNSIDLIYRIYAPSQLSEILRVLKNKGYLLTVTQGERHLFQLKEIIYDKVLFLSKKNDCSDDLKLIKTDKLQYTMYINDEHTVQSLIEMTPFGWKIKHNDLILLLSKKKWEIEVDFQIDLYQKT